MKKFLVLALIIFPLLASAHGSGGYVEKVEGNYLVDIGFTNPTLVEEETNRFDFSLFTVDNNNAVVDFDSVWVRFMLGEEAVLIANLPRLGLNAAILTYAFPKAGEYVMTVNYLKDSTTLVQTDFTMVVNGQSVEKQSSNNGLKTVITYLGVGVVVGIVVGRLLKKK